MYIPPCYVLYLQLSRFSIARIVYIHIVENALGIFEQMMNMVDVSSPSSELFFSVQLPSAEVHLGVVHSSLEVKLLQKILTHGSWNGEG